MYKKKWFLARQEFQALGLSEMPRKGYYYEPRGWPPDEEGKQGVNQDSLAPEQQKGAPGRFSEVESENQPSIKK